MEVTSSSLLQQAASLLSISSAPDELSTASQDAAALHLNAMAASANSGSLGAMTGVLSASLGGSFSNLVDAGMLYVSNFSISVDGVLSVEQERAWNNSALLATALGAVSAAQLLGVVPGMSPKQVVSKNIQVGLFVLLPVLRDFVSSTCVPGPCPR
jgi:hypothetical protein